MQKLIYRLAWVTILLAVASSFASAQDFVYFKKKAAVAAGASWSCTDADILCEHFEGSGYDAGNTWSETTTGGTIDEDTTKHVSFACTTSGSHSVRLAWTSQGVLRTQYDAGAAKPISYTTLDVVIDNLAIVNGEDFNILEASTTSVFNSLAYSLTLKNTGGTYNLLYIYYNGTGWTTITSSALLADTNYLIQVKHDYTNASTEFWINGVQQGGTAIDVGNRQPRYFGLGVTATPDASLPGNIFEVKAIKIDASAFGDICP